MAKFGLFAGNMEEPMQTFDAEYVDMVNGIGVGRKGGLKQAG